VENQSDGISRLETDRYARKHSTNKPRAAIIVGVIVLAIGGIFVVAPFSATYQNSNTGTMMSAPCISVWNSWTGGKSPSDNFNGVYGYDNVQNIDAVPEGDLQTADAACGTVIADHSRIGVPLVVIGAFVVVGALIRRRADVNRRLMYS